MSKTNQIVLAIWLVIAAFVAFLIAGVVTSRQSTEQQLRDRALSYARLVEQHASAAYDRVNIAIIGISDHVRPSDLIGAGPLRDARRRELEELLFRHQQRTAGVTVTFLTGADGRIVAGSARGPVGTNLSDRAYFQTLKREPRTNTVISEVVYGRESHTLSQIVARRIDLPDGSFGGMVGASLNMTENFSNFYSTLSLENNSTVLLRDSQNRLLVRNPIAEDKLGKQLSPGGPLNERIRSGDTEGAVLITSTIDNRGRVFAFHKLPNYPIYAIVGLSLDDALSGWRRNRNNAAFTTLLVLFAGVFVTVALRHKERADEELRDLNRTLEARVRERTKELSLANQRIVNVLEEERRRLARELHDRVSSNLAVVNLNLGNMDGQLSREERTRYGNTLADSAALVADSAASARDISSDLHPAILDYSGLVPALVDLGEKFQQRTNIGVTVIGTDAGRRLTADSELALFRIAQEALVNCAKHSGAKMPSSPWMGRARQPEKCAIIAIS